MKVNLITFHAGKAYKGAIFCECKLSEVVKVYQAGRGKGLKCSEDVVFEFLSELDPEDKITEKSKEWFVRAWDCDGRLLAEGWIRSTSEAEENVIKLRKLPPKDKGYWQLESKAWKSVKVK